MMLVIMPGRCLGDEHAQGRGYNINMCSPVFV